MKRISLGIVLLILVMVVAGCGGGGAAAPTKGDVTVYVAGPLSGFQANTGQTVAGGVRLMAEQLNRSGGLLGYKVKVVALDDEADSDVAVTRSQLSVPQPAQSQHRNRSPQTTRARHSRTACLDPQCDHADARPPIGAIEE